MLGKVYSSHHKGMCSWIPHCVKIIFPHVSGSDFNWGISAPLQTEHEQQNALQRRKLILKNPFNLYLTARKMLVASLLAFRQ